LYGATTFSVTTLSRMTPSMSILSLRIKLRHSVNDIQHNYTQLMTFSISYTQLMTFGIATLS